MRNPRSLRGSRRQYLYRASLVRHEPSLARRRSALGFTSLPRAAVERHGEELRTQQNSRGSLVLTGKPAYESDDDGPQLHAGAFTVGAFDAPVGTNPVGLAALT